mgnify:CR=1 FL=1
MDPNAHLEFPQGPLETIQHRQRNPMTRKTPPEPPPLDETAPETPPPAGEGAQRKDVAGPRDRPRVARLLSFVCPGLGQLVTGRWLTGLAQLGLFLLGGGIAVTLAVTQLVALYTSAFAQMQDSTAELATPDASFIPLLLGSVGLALVAWVWSILDAGKKTG